MYSIRPIESLKMGVAGVFLPGNHTIDVGKVLGMINQKIMSNDIPHHPCMVYLLTFIYHNNQPFMDR